MVPVNTGAASLPKRSSIAAHRNDCAVLQAEKIVPIVVKDALSPDWQFAPEFAVLLAFRRHENPRPPISRQCLRHHLVGAILLRQEALIEALNLRDDPSETLEAALISHSNISVTA